MMKKILCSLVVLTLVLGLTAAAMAEGGAEVHVLTLQDEEGRRIYERTLQFLLLAAARRALGPETRVRIEHSLGDGLYAYVPNQTLTSSQVRSIREAMQSLVAQDAPIARFASTKAEAAEYFRSLGQNDKVRLLQYRPYEHFTFYELDGMREYFYGEMAPSAGFVSVHDLILYYPGMVLMQGGTGAPVLPTVPPELAATPAPPATPTPKPTLMPVTTNSLPEGAKVMYVNASSLNLRAEPSMVGELLMRLQANQRVIVLEVCDDPEWVHVKTDVVEGYCMVSYLAEEGVKPTPTAQ